MGIGMMKRLPRGGYPIEKAGNTEAENIPSTCTLIRVSEEVCIY